MKFGQNNTASDADKANESNTDTARNDAAGADSNEQINKDAEPPKSESSDTLTGTSEGDKPSNSPEATDARLEQSKDLKPDTGQSYQGFSADISAKDAGLDVNKIERDPMAKAFAEQAAATAGVTEDSEVVYSSHPIAQLMVGAYRFEKTVLRLKQSQVADFEDLLDQLPASERSTIRKVSLDRVQDIVNAHRNSATQQFDSSLGRAALANLQAANPKVGTEELSSKSPEGFGVGFADVPQRDGNEPRLVPDDSNRM